MSGKFWDTPSTTEKIQKKNIYRSSCRLHRLYQKASPKTESHTKSQGIKLLPSVPDCSSKKINQSIKFCLLIGQRAKNRRKQLKSGSSIILNAFVNRNHIKKVTSFMDDCIAQKFYLLRVLVKISPLLEKKAILVLRPQCFPNQRYR